MVKRTEYVDRLSAQMVEWDAQVDLLKDKADSAMSEAKFEYSNAIEALQLKRDEAAVKLQGISYASDDEWEELKTGAEHVWGEVRNILRDAIMNIKCENEPDSATQYQQGQQGLPDKYMTRWFNKFLLDSSSWRWLDGQFY